MIIVRLKGGLGNQLFQYAAAKELAMSLGTSLKLDIALLEDNLNDRTKREYELDKFNIAAEIATGEEVKEVRSGNKTFGFRIKNIREKQFGFVKPFLKPGNSYYMNGYWQSEAFFRNISSTIRREFTFKAPLDGVFFNDLQRRIVESSSVAIHFRRGDYVSDAGINKCHGTCSMDYYQKAVERIAESVRNPLFFVFSDDIEWVKQNFRIDYPLFFVEESNEEKHSDFRLMSMCKHNIIANSSYSWWAAWLNPNDEKIVVAPRRWFRNWRKQLRSLKMSPKNWVKI